MTETYWKVVDGSGSVELYRGKVDKCPYPATPLSPQRERNKWKLLIKNYKLVMPTGGEYADSYNNDALLVNAYDHDRYLFIESRFIKAIPGKCSTCGKPMD